MIVDSGKREEKREDGGVEAYVSMREIARLHTLRGSV
jgi:hypothetical protein